METGEVGWAHVHDPDPSHTLSGKKAAFFYFIKNWSTTTNVTKQPNVPLDFRTSS